MMKTAGFLFLMLLKILGWMLVCLLLCLIVILLLAVFVPVRYQLEAQNIRLGTSAGDVHAEMAEEQKIQAKITWLLHFVSITFEYNQKRLNSRIRIAGINMLELFARFKQRRKVRQDHKQKKKKKRVHPKKTAAQQPESVSSQISFEAEESESRSEPKSESKSVSEVQNEAAKAEKKDTGKTVSKTVGHSSADRSVSDHNKKAKKHPESRFLGSVRQKASWVHKELTDESNHNAFLHLWIELCRILRHYGPRKCKADVAFSLADPAATGCVLGLVSLFPLIYRYSCHINPDFESETIYFEGEFMVSGRVTLGIFLISLVRLLRDKEVMHCVQRIRASKNYKPI